MKEAIRLTNRTAIALRRSAQRVRAVHIALVVVMTAALAALAVYWGLRWLPLAPPAARTRGNLPHSVSVCVGL